MQRWFVPYLRRSRTTLLQRFGLLRRRDLHGGHVYGMRRRRSGMLRNDLRGQLDLHERALYRVRNARRDLLH